MITALLLAALAAQPSPPAAATEPPRTATILVLPLEPRDGVSRDTAELTTSLIVARMRKVPGYTVVAYRDLEGALNIDMQRMRQDCNAVSCAADIAGALNADEVVMGSAGRLGPSVVMSLTRIRQKNASVVGSWAEQFEARDDSAMGLRVPFAVAELFPEYPELRVGLDPRAAASIRREPAPAAPREAPRDEKAAADEREDVTSLGRVVGVTARFGGGGVVALGFTAALVALIVGTVGATLLFPYVQSFYGLKGPFPRATALATFEYAAVGALFLAGGALGAAFGAFLLGMGGVAMAVSVPLLN